MKKTLLIIIATCLLLASCKKNNTNGNNSNPTKVDIHIENGSQYSSSITEVRFDQPIWNATTGEFDHYITLATADYNNGEISISLPATVTTTESDQIFTDLANKPDENQTIIENTFTTSDNNARIVVPTFNTYQSNNPSGFIYYANDMGSTIYSAYYCYADRDVTASGRYITRNNRSGYTTTSVSDFTLKKGWNMLYHKITKTDNGEETISSNTPPNVNLKWIFNRI